MKTPHKHAELIKLWADGAEIEVFDNRSEMWTVTTSPTWNSGLKYRIKPDPKPDVVYEVKVWTRPNCGIAMMQNASSVANLRIVFDGETGQLKAAEVLK